MSSRTNARPKHKNHEQDCGTLMISSASGDPAMVFKIWMTCILIGHHGHLARCVQRPDCCWTLTFERDHFGRTKIHRVTCGAGPLRIVHLRMIDVENRVRWLSNDHAITRATGARVLTNKLNDECCAFRAAPCNALRPSASGSPAANGVSTRVSRGRGANDCP
jgi:hypothetical protein